MSTAESFTCFGSLPPELRFHIWKEAIEVPCVWGIRPVYGVNDRMIDEIEAQGRWPPTMDPFENHELFRITPAPQRIGLVCREARQVSEESLTPIIAPKGCPTRHGVLWMDPERTIFHLGHLVNLPRTFGGLGEELLAKIQCVAVDMKAFEGFTIRFSYHKLMELCPNIRLLIFQRTGTSWKPSADDMLFCYDPDMSEYGDTDREALAKIRQWAPFYHRVIDQHAPQVIGCVDKNIAHIQSWVRDFGPENGPMTPPRMVFLGADSEPLPSFDGDWDYALTRHGA